MEQIVYNHILVRFGELSTKGKNRNEFIRKLSDNIRQCCSDMPDLRYERTHDRLYIHLNGMDPKPLMDRLKDVFGISSYSLAVKVESDIEAIKKTAYQMSIQSDEDTFKVETRRNDKQFLMISDEVNRAVATVILKNSDKKVDVHHPKLRIQIEIRKECTYIMCWTVKGAQGYPVGVGGKALLLLSGGIDSPVAGYLTMKRGVEIEAVHFASPPYTSNAAKQKVLDLASKISGYQGKIKVHVIPFTEAQLAIYENCDESYAITIMRRMMVCIAERIASANKCLALVTGESVGQVASQTLESMQTINDVTKMPILRPVVTYDKIEIIELAKKIGTYETSILPFEDCCTIFDPKNPVTKPKIERAVKLEEKFDFESLLDECEKNEEVIVLKPVKENKNLF